MTDEYSEYRGIGDNIRSTLIALSDELQESERRILELEEKLDVEKAKNKDLVEVRIPEVADGLTGSIDLGDGRELQLKETTRANISGDKKDPAIKWIDENGYGNIVKRQVIFEFSRTDNEKFELFMQKIRELGVPNLIMKTNFSIHHATLNSWVNEQLSEGVDLPRDIFGIYRQKSAKVKEK